DIELPAEVYRIDRIDRNQRPSSWEKLSVTNLEATARKETRKIPAGTIVVKTAQPLGSLAACLLEPQSEDGLGTWIFFNSVLQEGQDFPIVRLLSPVALTTGSASPLSEDSSEAIALANFPGPQPPGFMNFGIGGITWLDDGKHYLQ